MLSGGFDPVTGNGLNVNEPDILFGGEGDDLLIMGADDTGTGGDGADRFGILTDPSVGVTTLTDFDVAIDTVILTYPDGIAPPAPADVVFTASGSDTVVSMFGDDVLVLEGVAPSAVSYTDITFLSETAALNALITAATT